MTENRKEKAMDLVKAYILKNNISPTDEQINKINKAVKNFNKRLEYKEYPMPDDFNLNNLKLDIEDIFEEKSKTRQVKK